MVTVAMPTVTSPTDRDFSSVDAYLNARELHFWNDERAQRSTTTIEPQLPQQDVRSNKNEIPSALGRFFAQGDFSHGSGQPYFHYQSSDEAKYLYSEGFDISEPGLLKHINASLLANGGALAAGSSGKMAQAQGKLFVADGTSIRVYDPITGVAATESPHAGEAATTVYDLTAEGDRVFAALGANGIHVRDAAGVWTHYSDAQVILVEFLKDRIIAATARDFYEITAAGVAPTPKLTLKTGWTFTDLGENGPFIYAACNDGQSLSKIQIFGLDNSLALVHKGSSWLPENDLCFTIKGYLGLVLLGCGRVNNDGGRDALLYKAEPNADGFLPLQLIADSKGAGTLDLSVKAMATQGRKFLVGWCLGSGFTYGKREGMAVYDPALDSFANHHFYEIGAANPSPLLAVATFEGLHVWTSAKGVMYDDTTRFVSQATLITSIANWNNPGLKNWDESEISTKTLPNTSSVDIQYSLRHPEENVWSAAGSHTVPGATTATFRHANVESARLAIKLVSNATTDRTSAPAIEGFSVRANPTLANTEYRLIRTFHLIGTISKGQRGQTKHYNPRDERDALRNAINTWVSYYEPDASYTVRIANVQEIKTITNYATTQGDQRKEEYAVVVEMRGRQDA